MKQSGPYQLCYVIPQPLPPEEVVGALRSYGKALAIRRGQGFCGLLKSVGRLLPYVSAGGEWFSGVRGGVPERPKGAGCKPAGLAYGGSNPPAPTEENTLP